jgi:hypothetical protein
MKKALLLAALWLPLLVACSTFESPQDTLSKGVESIESWAATAHTVSDAWVRGDVPAPYIKLTLETAQEEIGKEATDLQQLPIQGRDKLLGGVGRVKEALKLMYEAAEHSDRVAMSQHLGKLASEEDALSKLADELGVQP